MNEITTNRTTALIAAEIINIKEQTKKMVIYNSIEIGRRLVEAKEMIEHGEWGKWLEKSISYSQSTANNLMKIFNEYGSDQITLLNDNSKSQALGNLSYTQAIALLGIPSDQRVEFAQVNDIESMSTRELQKAIKERDEAIEKAEIANKIASNKSEEAKKSLDEKFKIESELRTTDECFRDTQKKYNFMEKALRDEKEKSERRLASFEKIIAENKTLLSEAKSSGDNEEVERLQASLKETQGDLDDSALRIDELEAQLIAKPIDITETTIEKVPEEIEKELQELRRKVNQSGDQSVIKFKIYHKELQKTFVEQLELLEEIKKGDSVIYEKCKNAMEELLNKMMERL